MDHPQSPKAPPNSPAPNDASPKSETITVTIAPKQDSASLFDGLRSVAWSDLKEVHKKPCAKDSFLTGLYSGFGLGGLRLILGGSAWASFTFFYGAFAIGSLGQYQFCQRRRTIERAAVAEAQKALDIRNRALEDEMRKKIQTRIQKKKDDLKRLQGSWLGMGRFWYGPHDVGLQYRRDDSGRDKLDMTEKEKAEMKPEERTLRKPVL